MLAKTFVDYFHNFLLHIKIMILKGLGKKTKEKWPEHCINVGKLGSHFVKNNTQLEVVL